VAASLSGLAQADKTKRDEAGCIHRALRIALSQLRDYLQAEPVSLQTLPKSLLQQWVSADGRTRVQATPKGEPNDNEILRGFAQAIQAQFPDAIGPPISILESGRTVVTAFIQAGAFALISISILLWIVLRRFGDVLLTLVPLLLPV
jgi:hypothetical protein